MLEWTTTTCKLKSNKTLFLGVDPGLRYPAVFVLDGASSRGTCFEFVKEKSNDQKVRVVSDALIDYLANICFDCISKIVVGIERPFLGEHMNVKAYSHVIEQISRIKCYLESEDIAYVMVSPQDVKKAMTGSARATKEEVRDGFKEIFQGPLTGSKRKVEGLCDAAGVARAASVLS